MFPGCLMIDWLRNFGLLNQWASGTGLHRASVGSLCTVWVMLHHVTANIVILVGKDAKDRLWTDNHCLALTWLIMSWKGVKLSLHYC